MWIKYLIIRLSIFILWIALIPSSDCRSTNVTKPRLSIESNSIQRLVLDRVTTSDSRALKRVFLSNRTITCNDGSQAGFYLRKSPGAKKWVVFFEGGWHCYDHKSCRTRWMRLRHLMTSAQWPETRDVGGILSPTSAENPYWHDANHVLVPYCSSDSWSGTKVKPIQRDGWRFMGSLIVRQVIADLIPLGLGQSNGAELLLAGSSAGGLGVMLNLDKVKKFLHEERGIRVMVRGVSDSGWFLDREPYTPGAVAASEAVRQGWKLWEGSLPEDCAKEHINEPWRCYFGHRLYPTLKSPLFIFQWLFDEAQMRADSVGAPVTPQQWDYIHEMGGALRTSLDNVTAVFAPSCIGHSVLTKRDWLDIKIDDISLADALRCWETATEHESKFSGNRKRNLNDFENIQNIRRRRKKQQHQQQNGRRRKFQLKHDKRNKKNGGGSDGNNGSGNNKEKRRKGHKKNGRQRNQLPEATTIPRLERSPNPQDLQTQLNSGNVNSEQIPPIQTHKNRRRKNATHIQRNQRQQRQDQQHHQAGQNRHKSHGHHRPIEPKRCSLRLLERCSWPQCNHSCPTLTNPLTGEEMRFLELLASFGLDMEAVATALGVDMQTLNNMDHAELVNLLTQQVS